MCLCHFDVIQAICTWPHFNPRKKHVKTFFHDIAASKRDVSGHMHPTRLLKHFFEPISLLDMSLNQNKPKISSLRTKDTKHSYCIFRLSIQASRNKSWNVKWTTGSVVLWTKNRVPTQFSQKTERKSEMAIPCLVGYLTLLYNSILVRSE